jgi:hypothetical protein
MLIEQSPWILFSLLDTVAAYFLSTFAGINPPSITENCFYLAYLPFMILAGIFLAEFNNRHFAKKEIRARQGSQCPCRRPPVARVALNNLCRQFLGQSGADESRVKFPCGRAGVFGKTGLSCDGVL